MELILNKDNFDETIKDGVVLVDFWATWCGPCKMLAPNIEAVAEEYDGRVKVCKVDVDDNPDIAQRYSIFSIPTVFIFKDGELKEKLVGFRAKSQLEEVLDKYL